MKNNKHYIDNKLLYTELSKYLSAVKQAGIEGKPKPKVPNYIGLCIMQIAENLSHLPQWRAYPFREEMVGDAILNCLQYLDNFDPDKSKNPFGYYTTISYFAFLRRIEREKKYLYTKHKAEENIMLFDSVAESHDYDDSFHMSNIGIQHSEGATQNTHEFVKKFEENMNKKRKKKE